MIRAVGVPPLASTLKSPVGGLALFGPIAKVIVAPAGTKTAVATGMEPAVVKPRYIVFDESGLYTMIVWVLSNGATAGVTAVPALATAAFVPTIV